MIKKQVPFPNARLFATTNIGSQLDSDMFGIFIRLATQHVCPPVVVWGSALVK